MYQLATKLRLLSKSLKPIRCKFSGAAGTMDNVRQRLQDLQDQRAKEPSNQALLMEEHDCRKQFIFWCKAARSFILHKTKAAWLLEGDVNTRFFHDTLRQKHYRQWIYSITSSEGVVIKHYDAIIAHFQNYYWQLLGSAETNVQKLDQEIISEGPVLTIEQQLSLLTKVTSDEIKEALWSIPMDKTPGLDGFGSGF